MYGGIGSLPDDYGVSYGDDELMGGGQDPLSIRLNNPGAIRRSGIQWAGMAPEQPSGFVAFQTPEDGIRAMSKNLDAYGAKYGLNTVEGIIGRWAPSSENDTNAYVARVSKALGVRPDQPLDLGDPQVKSKLMSAMAGVEAGRDHYTQDMILKALQGGGKAPMQQPYDEDQGLANIQQMGARVAEMQPQGGAGIGSLQARPQQVGVSGLSALNPYMQIAAQLMPERQGSAWGDALINAGAAMMQSRSPDFLGAAGAGLAAGNQALQARRQGDRQDTLDRFKFGMQLAQYDQKDAGEWAVGEGVMFNKKTGEVRSVGGKAQSDLGKLQADLREGRIGPEEYQIAITKMRGENESPAMKAIRELGLDPKSPQAQKILQDYALRVGGGTTTNVDLRGEGKFQEELAKGEAATFNDIRKAAAEAPQSNARLERLSNLLEDVQTGKFASSLLELQKGLDTVLGRDNSPKVYGKSGDIAKAEAAQALSREIALTLRNPAGGAGMPGALSDSDRRFLESMTPGLETTPQGRALMLDTARALNKRNVEVARLAQQYVKDNGGRFTGFEVFLADWSEKNPLFKPQEKPAQKPQATTAPAPTMTAPGSSLTVTTPNADGSTKTQQVPVGGAGMADRIRQMSRDEMLRLDMTKMTQEELKAAADRWEQINRAGGQ